MFFLICSLFTASMIGCQKTGNTPDDPSPPRDSMRIDGDVKLLGEVSWIDSTEELKTKIWAVNSGSDTAKIETGTCAFKVLAYSSGEEAQELVWHSKMPENYICPDVLLTYTIPPNDTLLLKDQFNIGGNKWHWSVPNGKWKFVLEARTEEGQTIIVNANTETIQ
jgi:hypothetical protein